MDAIPSDLQPDAGMRVGQYEIVRQLGKGGMGEIFLAVQRDLGRLVAVKFLPRILSLAVAEYARALEEMWWKEAPDWYMATRALERLK